MQVREFAEKISFYTIVSLNIIEKEKLIELSDNDRFMYLIWVKLNDGKFYISEEKNS